MSFIRTTLCASALILSAQAVFAETTLDQTNQKDISLTIYQNGLGFVKDQRTTFLKEGPQTLAFEDISAKLIPDSLLISGSGFSIVQRRFAFDLLSPQILLEKSIGKNASFRRLNPVTGKDELIKAKILSNQGSLIIERDGQIEIGQPGRLVLDSLPEGLRPKPALLADLYAQNSGDIDLALAYLTNGLKWHTSYSAEISEDGKSIALRSWANLTNTSGVNYKNVDLNVAAGRINRRSPNQRPVQMMAKAAPRAMSMAMDSAAESTARAPHSVGGVYIYKLPSRVDLNNKETKQVALMKPQTFKSKRILTKRFGPVYNAFHEQPVSPVHPNIELSFTNSSGQPLPEGITRLYQKDTTGHLQFVGEDRLKLTPNNITAKLNPAQSSDVTLLRTQTDFKVTGKHHFQAAYKIVFKNAKKTEERVRITEIFTGEWQLEKSSHEPIAKSGKSTVWELDIPAGGEKILNYRVDVKTR